MSANRLQGKTVLITGASSGIGRYTALQFARTAPSNGLRLILTARRIDKLKTLAVDIQAETGNGVQVLPVQLDVSQPAMVRDFVANLPETWRDIHVLVNNAYGSLNLQPLFDVHFCSLYFFPPSGLVKGVSQAPHIIEDDMNVMFATNVAGLVNMTQAILPIFLKRGTDGGAGDVINIGSIAGIEPYPGGSIYCATKAAVKSFTDSLRKELIATRIRVIEVDPGQVETVRREGVIRHTRTWMI